MKDPITYEDSLGMPEDRLEEIIRGESRCMPVAADHYGNIDVPEVWMIDPLKRFLGA